MRQLLLQVPDGRGEEVARRAGERGAATSSWWTGRAGDGTSVDLLSLSLPNAEVGPLLTELEDLGQLEAVVPSSSVYAFEPPSDRPSAELVDVTARSPVEVFLAGQQSAGSWRGFLSYAVVAGVVVWIGLYTETSYLLTAAMLLAPFAGPAMNTAIGVASGDRDLLRQSVLRYLAGVAVTAVASAVMTLVVGQHEVTGTTVEVLSLSNIAVLLPVAAGLAGATHLIQSEHSSLVSGAAVGMLVAASLAPPTGGLGIALAIGRWDLVGPALFTISAQLVGITLVAAVVFRLYGLTAGRGRFEHGRRRLFPVAMSALSVALVALLLVQFLPAAALQTGSLAQTAAEIAADETDADSRVELLDVSARQPSRALPGPTRVLIEVDAELRSRDAGDPSRAETDLADAIRRAVDGRLEDVRAVVDVTVHPATEAAGTGRAFR